ncbi:MAG: hypothetical protein JHC25_04400 [Thermodesulfobacterium sp.]|jgi:hypothetical protein|nr:hypothetical protein [Thermodesulfobacterium sp.]
MSREGFLKFRYNFNAKLDEIVFNVLGGIKMSNYLTFVFNTLTMLLLDLLIPIIALF